MRIFKIKKKTIFIICIVALVSFMLSACGESDSTVFLETLKEFESQENAGRLDRVIEYNVDYYPTEGEVMSYDKNGDGFLTEEDFAEREMIGSLDRANYIKYCVTLDRIPQNDNIEFFLKTIDDFLINYQECDLTTAEGCEEWIEKCRLVAVFCNQDEDHLMKYSNLFDAADELGLFAMEVYTGDAMLNEFNLVPYDLASSIEYNIIIFLDGLGIEEEIIKEYSTNSTYYETRKITEAEYKDICFWYNYEDIARNPEVHEGANAVYTGEVIQVLEEGNDYNLRVNITYEDYGYGVGYYKDTIFVVYTRNENDSRILEGDIVTIYGKNAGLLTYESTMGNMVTLPKVNAKYIDLEYNYNW